MKKKKTICIDCKNCVKESYYSDGWFGRRNFGDNTEYIRCEITNLQTGKKKLINSSYKNDGNCEDFSKGTPRKEETYQERRGNGMFD